jgi:hypothetical protein
MARTLVSLIMEYFEKHPNENLEHVPVVDWVIKYKQFCIPFLVYL